MPLHPKLKVGDANEPAERDADELAERVLESPLTPRGSWSEGAFGSSHASIATGTAMTEAMPSEGAAPEPIAIVVRVPDVALALAFYRQVFEADSVPGAPSVLFPGGGRSVAIHVVPHDYAAPHDMEDPSIPRLELAVDDVEEWLERAVASGASVKTKLDAPGGHVTYAQFEDPFGYRWALTIPRVDPLP